MKFHPAISIILGLIISAILFAISIMTVNATSVEGNVVNISTLMVGGFIATYFSRDKKIRYSIYMGLLLAVLSSIIIYIKISNDLAVIIPGLLYFPLIALMGGLLGKMKFSNIQKTKRFSLILMVMAVIIICIVALSLLLAYLH